MRRWRFAAALALLAISLHLPVLRTAPQPGEPPTNLSVRFGSPIRTRDPLTGVYDVLELPGSDLLMRPGRPMVPVRTLVIRVPAGVEVSGVSVSLDYGELPGTYNLSPAPEPVPLDGRNPTAPLVRPNRTIYSSPEFYPEENFTYELRRGLDPDTMQEVTYLIVRVFPLKYRPTDGKILVAGGADVRVYYSGTPQPRRISKNMAIITTAALQSAADTLKAAREGQGWTVTVETVSDIEANYPGVDTPEKIRNFIADAHSSGTDFFVILGDADQVPARLAYIPDGYDDSDDPSYAGDGSYVETDLYYADLDGDWDFNGNGRYGELTDHVDGIPDVFLGRLPASTLDEANDIVAKVAGYSPDKSWFNLYQMFGTVTFGDRLTPEGEIVKDKLEYEMLPPDFAWGKLYEQTGDLTHDNVVAVLNAGSGFVNFAGHGWDGGWWFGDGGSLTYSDVMNLTNGGRLPVVFASACETARFYDVDSVGEAFLLNPNGGGIAYFGSSRIAWGYVGWYTVRGLTDGLDLMFNSEAFSVLPSAEPYLGRVIAGGLRDYVTSIGIGDKYDWKTVAEFGTMFGDPTTSLAASGTPPAPTPAPRLYGHVYDSSGSPIPNAHLRLINASNGAVIAETDAGADGSYEFVDMPPMTALLNVTNAPSSYVSSRQFYLARVNLQVDVTVISKPLPPNTVLVVADDDSRGEGVWPDEIASAVESAGPFNALVFSESEHGTYPPLEMMMDAVAVVWTAGNSYGPVDSQESVLLRRYVSMGGPLILEGEDIGYSHPDAGDPLMLEVAHAVYRVDDAGSSQVDVTDPTHPVVQGLTSPVSFTAKPPYPDGVAPANGGHEVMAYSGTNYSAAVVYDGSAENLSRVVYFAFPLHYLSDSDKETLIHNSLNWILCGDAGTPETTGYLLYASGGAVVLNASFAHWDNITSVEYSVDGGTFQPVTPWDGAADEAREVFTASVDASGLSEGYHRMTVRVTDVNGTEFQMGIEFYVVHLRRGWSMVALAEPPLDQLEARDVAEAIGPQCTVVSYWDTSAGEYRSYLPGVSPEDYDFPVEMGRGYFVFLTGDGTLVTVRGQESPFKFGWW